jgi:hypothetical protein
LFRNFDALLHHRCFGLAFTAARPLRASAISYPLRASFASAVVSPCFGRLQRIDCARNCADFVCTVTSGNAQAIVKHDFIPKRTRFSPKRGHTKNISNFLFFVTNM